MNIGPHISKFIRNSLSSQFQSEHDQKLFRNGITLAKTLLKKKTHVKFLTRTFLFNEQFLISRFEREKNLAKKGKRFKLIFLKNFTLGISSETIGRKKLLNSAVILILTLIDLRKFII